MKKIFIKKNVPLFVLFFVVIGISLSFLGESAGRSLALAVLTTSLILAYLFTENLTFSLLLFLILALPFNITYQLPFGFEKSLVDGISVNYLVPTISILDMSLGIFFVIIITKKSQILKEVFREYKYPLIIFSLFLIIQNIILKNPLAILSSLRLLLYVNVFLILLKLWKMERKGVNYKFTSITLLLSVLFQGITGLLQFLKGSSLGLNFLGESQGAAGLVGSSFVGIGGEVFLRASGTFPHPNILAGFFLLSFFLAIFLTKRLQKNHKIITFFTIALSFIFTIFTFSRVVILLFFLVFIVFFLSKIFFKKENLSFSFPLIFERFLNVFSKEDSSWIDRVNLAKASFVVIKKNLFLGTGLGNYVKGMEGFFPTTSRSMPLLQPVHNIFLLLLSELGIFGFSAYIYLFWEIFRKNHKKITIYGTLILMAIFTIGMFDHYFISLPQGQIIFFLFLFLAIIESNEDLKYYKKNINKN